METVLAYSLGSRKCIQNVCSKEVAVEPEVGQNAALEVALAAVRQEVLVLQHHRSIGTEGIIRRDGHAGIVAVVGWTW